MIFSSWFSFLLVWYINNSICNIILSVQFFSNCIAGKGGLPNAYIRSDGFFQLYISTILLRILKATPIASDIMEEMNGKVFFILKIEDFNSLFVIH